MSYAQWAITLLFVGSIFYGAAGIAMWLDGKSFTGAAFALYIVTNALIYLGGKQ